MIDPIDNNLSTKSEKSAEEFPGKLLRQKRESMKITQEEVAERLHLNIDVIKALENDNYDALPGTTYIKGYQRSYAALLGASVEENSPFVSESETSEQLLPENINYSNETKTRKFTYIWVSAVLLILLVAFSETVQIDNTSPEQQVPEVEKDGVENKTATNAAIAPTDSKSATDSMTAIDDKTKTDNDVTTNMPEVGIAESAQQAKAEAINKNKPEKFTGLVLKYEKSSWTEVYGADGKKLVYGMIKSGETIQVRGLQPYSVLLGNAEAVKVKYAGKAFSTEQYMRNGMVQFVIGSSYNNKK